MKTKTEHTPGPWIVIDGIGCGSMMVAEANAKLIAQAPELLSFARFIEAWLICPALDKETLQSVQNQARAAIAKATGKT